MDYQDEEISVSYYIQRTKERILELHRAYQDTESRAKIVIIEESIKANEQLLLALCSIQTFDSPAHKQ